MQLHRNGTTRGLYRFLLRNGAHTRERQRKCGQRHGAGHVRERARKAREREGYGNRHGSAHHLLGRGAGRRQLQGLALHIRQRKNAGGRNVGLQHYRNRADRRVFRHLLRDRADAGSIRRERCQRRGAGNKREHPREADESDFLSAYLTFTAAFVGRHAGSCSVSHLHPQKRRLQRNRHDRRKPLRRIGAEHRNGVLFPCDRRNGGSRQSELAGRSEIGDRKRAGKARERERNGNRHGSAHHLVGRGAGRRQLQGLALHVLHRKDAGGRNGRMQPYRNGTSRWVSFFLLCDRAYTRKRQRKRRERYGAGHVREHPRQTGDPVFRFGRRRYDQTYVECRARRSKL